MDRLVAALPDGFATRTHAMTLRVHDVDRYHRRLDECRHVLKDMLAQGEVFLVYDHLHSGYMDAMVVRGVSGSDAFPGVLDELTPKEAARLRHVTIGLCELGVVPCIVNDRVDAFLGKRSLSAGSRERWGQSRSRFDGRTRTRTTGVWGSREPKHGYSTPASRRDIPAAG
jgi:hypothetical protein